MKKKLLLLALIILPLAASAEIFYTIEIDGICYNLNTEGNIAEITQHSPSYSGDVVIPETVTYKDVVYSVTGIDFRTFMDDYELTSVSIPNSVTTIEDEAFVRCKNLASITIPSSVTTIGNHVFDGCTGLKKLIVPDIAAWCGISIGSNSNPLSYARYLYSDENTEITDLVIPESVTYIKPYRFANCLSLTSVSIPNNKTVIDKGVFSGCIGLTSVTMNTYITANLFENCIHLTSFTFGDNVTRIGESAFSGCTGLNSITFSNSLESIDQSAFYNCSRLTSITLPKNLTSIGKSAFDGCRLENVLTRNSKTSYSEAFSDRTCQHAMLYILEGTWGEAVYEGSWYTFNNIRETAMTPESLSPAVIYTLMDTNTFGYAAYDTSSDEVTMVKAFYSIDEQNANNCWQVKTQGGQKYLYSVGAKKYASIASDGHISLSETPMAVTMQETDNGIMIGTGTNRQWAFVKNSDQTGATGIAAQPATLSQQSSCCYTIDGQRMAQPKKGLNIIRMGDGTTKKVVVR